MSLQAAICKDAAPTPPEGTPAQIGDFLELCFRKVPSPQPSPTPTPTPSPSPRARLPKGAVTLAPTLTLLLTLTLTLTLTQPPSGKAGRPAVHVLMLSPWLQPHSAGDAEATTRAYLEELGIVT